MIRDEALRDLCRALSGAVKSGLPLTEAFETLSKDPKHRKYLSGVAALTASGTPMHAAFAGQGIYPPVFTSLLRAGEEGGKTEEFLDLYADTLDVRIDFARRLGRVLILPGAAAALAAALFFFLLLVAAPQILGPLKAAGASAPEADAAAAFAAALASAWPWVLGGAGLAFLLLRALWRTGPARKLASLAGHFLPVFRYASERSRLYYAYTTMGLLLKAGFPLGAMMDVLLQLEEDDPALKSRFAAAASALAGGNSFSASLAAFFPPDDARAVEIAEKAGRLDETLLRLAKMHREVHLHRLKKLVTYTVLGVTSAAAFAVFLLLVSVIRPVFSALGSAGAAAEGGGKPGLEAPEERAGPSRIEELQRAAAFETVEPDTRTAAFNEAYGGIIAKFMREKGVAPGTGGDTPVGEGEREEAPPAPALGQVRAAASASGVSVPAVSRPAPLPKLKPRQGGIKPTRVAPTGVVPEEVLSGQ